MHLELIQLQHTITANKIYNTEFYFILVSYVIEYISKKK